MLVWILAGIVFYAVAILSPGLFLLPQIGVSAYVGPRDTRPDAGVLEGRARRAVDNLRENFPVFLGLGALGFAIPTTDMGLATMGAAIFVIARVTFHVIYLMGIPVVRSIAWMVGAVGLAMMAIALV